MNATQVLGIINRCMAENGNPDGAAPKKLGWEGYGPYNGHAVLTRKHYRDKGHNVPPRVVAVVMHEGQGPLGRFFTFDACAPNGWGKAEDYATYEAMCGSEGVLREAGLWAEMQNSYCSYIYKD